MSSVADAIIQIAKEVAELARDETQSYQKKIDEAKQHLDELTARLKLAREAPTRLDSFDVQIGGDYQCPHCWIRDGVKSALRPVGNSEGDADLFRCNTCDRIIEIPARG